MAGVPSVNVDSDYSGDDDTTPADISAQRMAGQLPIHGSYTSRKEATTAIRRASISAFSHGVRVDVNASNKRRVVYACENAIASVRKDSAKNGFSGSKRDTSHFDEIAQLPDESEWQFRRRRSACLLYTSDAADE